MDLAYEFNRIFTGNTRGHGEFTITSKKGLKSTGLAKTVKGPVNEDLWRKHLAGEIGIGIVPIMEDNNCTWGAVDVDDYDGLDLEEMSLKIPAPLVLCRSKSGGMHVMLFTNTPVPATLLRKKLALVARALGHPTAEIFPKQDTLNDGDIGNWINSPYHNSESTVRYCLKGGVALTAEEFISFVGESSMNIQQLVAWQPDPIVNEEDSEFADAPPCLRALVKSGFPPGSRNSALFSMGVFARMKFVTGWEDKVFEYNQRFMGPGSYSEVAGVIRSLNKKTYVYKCKDQPLLQVCDKEGCSECSHGVQPSKDDEKSRRPNILDDVERPVRCYAPASHSKDEPYWVFCINGVNIDVTVDMARSQSVFAREYLRQYHQVILPVKDKKWVDAMNEILAGAEVKQLAPDAGPEGQLWIHLEDFCTNKAKAKVKEELLLGKPWDDDGRTYFRSNDFIKYLDQQRFRALKDKDLFSVLKRNGAKHHDMHLKGKHVNCWSIGTFGEQNEGFDMEVMDNVSNY